jgi:hypothetical protein
LVLTGWSKQYQISGTGRVKADLPNHKRNGFDGQSGGKKKYQIQKMIGIRNNKNRRYG